jgi:hypothetical protein
VINGGLMPVESRCPPLRLTIAVEKGEHLKGSFSGGKGLHETVLTLCVGDPEAILSQISLYYSAFSAIVTGLNT